RRLAHPSLPRDFSKEAVRGKETQMVGKKMWRFGMPLKLLKTAVEWEALDRMPCSIRLLPLTKSRAAFHDFEAYERLVEASKSDPNTNLIVLLGGEAGLRCGEMMAL